MEALSHKVDEYKQYLIEKSGHLTKTIPYPGFKFKFLHMHQLLDTCKPWLITTSNIIRENHLTNKVSVDEGNQMIDFPEPVEVKSGPSISSPSQDLFIDTLTVILVPDNETVSS